MHTQVGFNRVPEKIPEKVADKVPEEVLRKNVKIKRCDSWDTTEACFLNTFF